MDAVADELIRQVTISCAERGLLLLRVRDEMRMTTAAYQTLYESSVAFGMRKALQTEQGKSDMETRIQQLEAEQKELERQVWNAFNIPLISLYLTHRCPSGRQNARQSRRERARGERWKRRNIARRLRTSRAITSS